jgi:hypothetical protein
MIKKKYQVDYYLKLSPTGYLFKQKTWRGIDLLGFSLNYINKNELCEGRGRRADPKDQQIER